MKPAYPTRPATEPGATGRGRGSGLHRLVGTVGAGALLATGLVGPVAPATAAFVPLTATGGQVSTLENGYTLHTFSEPGTFTFSVASGSGQVEFLLVGGGGGGGGCVNGGAGGGGAGGVVGTSWSAVPIAVTAGDEIEVRVGDGGRGASCEDIPWPGGVSSLLGSFDDGYRYEYANGGGMGGGSRGQEGPGHDGASGGGASWGMVPAPPDWPWPQPYSGGGGIGGQGNPGGGGQLDQVSAGGGGGGKGGFGRPGQGADAGRGGPGISITSFIGTPRSVAGGGGGSVWSYELGSGQGSDGGGHGFVGGPGAFGPGTPGAAQTGGGGGAGLGASPEGHGGSGGSGAVYLRYRDPMVAPAFSQHPQAWSGTSGQTATFTALASGNPAPTLRWQRSADAGATWTDLPATSSSYSFTAAAADDGAWVRLQARNSQGTAYSDPAVLSVAPLPAQILTGLSDVDIDSGQAPSWAVIVAGDPAPTVTWSYSDDEGASWTQVPGATGTSYAAEALTTAQDGRRYRVQAVNGAGTADRVATVTVRPTAPGFTTQPADAVVPSGHDATFAIEVSGDPVPELQWERSDDGGLVWLPLPGATEAAVEVAHVRHDLDDGAMFRAVATSTEGSTTSEPATLTVPAEVPAFLGHPSDQVAPSGGTATFTVAHSADPVGSLRWERSDDGGATWSAVPGGTGSTLTLHEVRHVGDDGALLRAVVTNSEGTAVSNAAALTVHPGLPAFTDHPGDQLAASGDGATFTATATGDPDPDLQWQRSNDDGATWQDLPGGTSPTLVLDDLTHAGDDGARFRVVATSAGGARPSDSAVLTVLASAPAILQAPTDQLATSGGAATFTVTTAGDPDPELQWQRSDDEGATWQDLPGQTEAALVLEDLTHVGEDGTRFRVVATSPGGVISSAAATLTVHPGAPVVASHPADRSAAAGGSVTFAVAVSGDPAPDLQWQQSTDGATWSDLPGEGASTLTLRVLPYDLDGTQVRVVARNTGATTVSQAATLTVGSPTHVPARYLDGDLVVPGRGAAVTVDGLPHSASVTARDEQVVVDAGAFSVQAGASDGGERPSEVPADGTLMLVPGGFVVVSGRGFAPGTDVAIWLFSTPQLLGSVVVDADGSFHARLPVPGDVPAGGHTLQLNGLSPSGGTQSVALHVAVPAPTSAGTALGGSAAGDGGGLAHTGVDVGAVVALAVAMLLSGGAMVVGGVVRCRASRIP